MLFTTRILNPLFQYLFRLQYRLFYLQKHFAIMFGLLLMGFVIGNIFGTILNVIRQIINWDGLIIICFLFLFEIFSYAVYHSRDRTFLFFLIHPQVVNRRIWQFANFFKIGVMIGFFIDAFKVGS